MTYEETLKFLYSRLPMFSRQGKSAIKPGLDNIIRLCDSLGQPQNKFRSIHIGGTNGKGSSSHMLAAIFQKAGYKTGLYTSPHLRDFRERIRINGEMIPESEVVDFVSSQTELINTLGPSFFEVTVAMTFHFFARHQIDIAIIEVGLGGRLDSTNIINPELSLITNIGYDHMNILGDTLPKIAAEKAGIIKQKVPVIIGQRQNETESVFLEKAAKMNSKIIFASEEWEIKKSTEQTDSSGLLKLDIRQKSEVFEFGSLELDLTGTYQLKNLAGVLSAVKELRLKGFNLSDETVKDGLRNVKSLTGLMGRWQTLEKSPLIICDTGHNEDGIKEVLKNISLTPYHNLHMVIGMVNDKDIHKILALLPKNAAYYFCQPDIPRARPSVELRDEALKFNLNGDCYQSVADALKSAKSHAQPEDLIFVGGSTFVVAEVV